MKIVYTLGGGAAYGYVHIGVLKYLEERKLRPDAIVGTSMGAIVGGLYAAGFNAERIRDIAEEVRGFDLMRLFFPSFPRGGIIDTDGIREFFRAYVGEVRIEDLPVLYRSVAVDIESGDEIVFDRGRLLDAMIASMSIPAVFKPYSYGGRCLVDGGVVNNLPWDIARQYGRNHIIVNAAPERTTARRRLYSSELSDMTAARGCAPEETPAPDANESGPFARAPLRASRKADLARPEAAPAAPAEPADGGPERRSMIPLRRLRSRFSGRGGISFQQLMKSFGGGSEEQEKSPGIPEIVTQVIAIVNERVVVPRSSRGWTYAYIRPDLTGYSLNDFQKAGEIIDIGYRSAQNSSGFGKAVRTIANKRRRG